MYNPSTVNLTRDIYARNHGNINKTWKELQQKGYRIDKRTIARWRDKKDFEGYRKAYEEKILEYSEKVLDLEKKLLLELIEQKDEVREAMNKIDKKKQANAYGQLNYSYLGYMKLIIALRTNNGGNIEEVIDMVIGAFFQDPVTQKTLASRRKDLAKLVKKK